MGIDLVLQQRLMLGAPAPLGHVRTVTLDQEGKTIVERPPQRAAAIRIRLAGGVTPGGMVAHEGEERFGGERSHFVHFHARFFHQQILVQRAEERGEDERARPGSCP